MKNRAGYLPVLVAGLFLSFAALLPAATPGLSIPADQWGQMFGNLSMGHQACVIGFLVGTLILLIGQLLFLICAFGESIWWGLACLFVPVIPPLAFVLMRWEYARGAYLITLLGGAVMAGSSLIGLLAIR